MKWILFVLFLVIIGGYFVTSQRNKSKEQVPSPSNNSVSTTPSTKPDLDSPIEKTGTSVFVPYWSASSYNESSEFDEPIYFGISANTEGIITDDAGYASLDAFAKNIQPSDAGLTLRMLDTESNFAVLEDEKAQKRIISDLNTLLDEYPFHKVILDLEISAIPFTDVEHEITQFTSRLSQSLADEGVSFGMTVYGDTHYRARPYNLLELNKSVDSFYIMAYDFHKSRGEPGPNFPLTGKKEYGYDFKTMINDISQSIPKEKITIVYGMYGYDWTLGPQGKPLKQAVAKTDKDIQEEFSPCQYADCISVTDSNSGETKIRYTDEEQYHHVVWYENEESVALKEAYAQSQGIGGKGYWAYGYW